MLKLLKSFKFWGAVGLGFMAYVLIITIINMTVVLAFPDTSRAVLDILRYIILAIIVGLIVKFSFPKTQHDRK